MRLVDRQPDAQRVAALGDVVHAHDWEAAPAILWLTTAGLGDERYRALPTVYTIHNLAYQGVFGYRVLEVAGIAAYGFMYHPEMADLAEVATKLARSQMILEVAQAASARVLQTSLLNFLG